MANNSLRSRLGSHPYYPWLVVGMLWFAGFFNYADRQGVFSVFPLIKSEFDLSKSQLGYLGSAFMVVYAASSPFSGYTVDLLPRRLLITLGLTFWSLICAATALSRSYYQLLFFAAPRAWVSRFTSPRRYRSCLIIMDLGRDRGRSVSIRQACIWERPVGRCWRVISGNDWAGDRRSGSWDWLVWCMPGYWASAWLNQFASRRATRSSADRKGESGPSDTSPAGPGSLSERLWRILANPAAALLLTVFVGANFVAGTFLAWLPSYIFERFDLGLSTSSFTSTFWPLASLPGAILGGLAADWSSRRSRGGRMRVQSAGLIVASPFVFLTGWSSSVPVLIAALIGAGICKGVYDSNIFASLFDVIRPEDRGTAAGLMNTVGWSAASAAPTVVGIASERFGLGVTIASTATVYLLAGLLASWQPD